MARVLFYTGISLLAVSAALLYLPTYFSFLILAITLICLIVRFILYKKLAVKGLTVLLCTVLAFTILGIGTQLSQIKPAEKLVDYEAEIIGTVTEFPELYENYTVYIIKTEQIKLIQKDSAPITFSVPQNLKLRLSDINKIGAKVFDKLHLKIEFNDLDIYKTSSLANKIYAGGYIDSLVEHLGENRPFYAIFYDLRQAINNLLFENMQFNDAAVISAVLLGDKNNLDPDFENDSRLAGTTHMLVVSGMHLGILFQLLSRIFHLLKIRRGLSEILMLFAIFALTAVCGFTPSVMRASLTYVILVIGKLFFRKPDSLNSLGTATIILLFFNPLGFGNLSLLLSLLSTFGLLFICPIMESVVVGIISKIYTPKRIASEIIFSVCQTLSATLATMPVCILGIGYISLISPVTNLLIAYASSLLTSFSFLAVILLCLPSVFKALAVLPVFILYALVRFIVKITDICASVDYAAIPSLNEYLISLALILLVIPLIMLSRKFCMKKNIRITLKITASALVLLSVSSALFFYTASPKYEIAIPNVGKGTCVLIKTETDVIAIGTGDSPSDYHKIESQLFKMGSREIDYIILPTASKSFAAATPEAAFKNPNATVIYPKTGDYTDKINYIANKNFTSFDGSIHLNLSDSEIMSYIDCGTTINFENLSLIVYTGTGDLNLLLNAAKHNNPVFICANNLNQKLEHSFKRCIITGSDEAKISISKTLKNDNINHEILGNKTISIKF